jgi:hypothetical protein
MNKKNDIDDGINDDISQVFSEKKKKTKSTIKPPATNSKQKLISF